MFSLFWGICTQTSVMWFIQKQQSLSIPGKVRSHQSKAPLIKENHLQWQTQHLNGQHRGEGRLDRKSVKNREERGGDHHPLHLFFWGEAEKTALRHSGSWGEIEKNTQTPEIWILDIPQPDSQWHRRVWKGDIFWRLGDDDIQHENTLPVHTGCRFEWEDGSCLLYTFPHIFMEIKSCLLCASQRQWWKWSSSGAWLCGWTERDRLDKTQQISMLAIQRFD